MEETRKPRIRRIATYRYLVESRSQPGIGHQVDTLRLRCSCLAGKHGRRCHHLVVALAYEDWRRRQLLQAATSARPSAAPWPCRRPSAKARHGPVSNITHRPNHKEE